jgi:hypothetical protein
MARSDANTRVVYGSYSFDSQPTPFVTMEQTMDNDFGGTGDGRWGRRDSIKLNGILTGVAGGDSCGTSGPSGDYFGNLADAQMKMINGFGRDFSNIEIQEYDGSNWVGFYTGHNCVVRNVSFEESTYVGLLNYDITLDAYDVNNWSSVQNALGVINPSDTYEFSQDPEDEIIKISHNISAQGYNVGAPNALDNAIDFVRGRTGYKFASNSPFDGPNFIPNSGSAVSGCFLPALTTQSESIDRMEGTYSVSETYEADPSGCSGIILKYSTSLESGISEDYVSATIDGEAKHSKTGVFSDLRDYVNDLNIYDLLIGDISYNNLNQIPITLSITENPSGKAIRFQASYDDNKFITTDDNAYYDYNVSLSTDDITKVTTAVVNGDIKSRGNLNQRETSSSAFLDSEVYPANDPSKLRTMAQGVYDAFIGLTYNLNTYPTSLSVVSGVKGEINVSATFTDKDQASEDTILRDSVYSYEVKTAIPIYKPKAAANENGLYTIFDTNIVSREMVSISSQLVGSHANDNTAQSNAYSADLEGIANGLINTLRNSLGDGAELRLEGESISRDDVGGDISCSYNYSQNKPPLLLEDEFSLGQTIKG